MPKNMLNICRALTAAGALCVAFTAHAAVDFNTKTITHAMTTAEIQTALGVGTTFSIDGVAVAPDGDVYIMHRDASANETFARLNLATKTATWQKSIASVASDLGAPYTSNITPVGEFVFDPNAGASGSLYFADNSTANPDQYSVIRIDIATSVASEVIRSGDIEGWNSHGFTPTGKIVGVLGEDHLAGPRIGVVDPATAAPRAFTTLYTEDDFKDVLPEAQALPVEAIGIHPVSGDAYIFAHDELELFKISNIDNPTTITHLEVSGWNGVVDLHGLTVDAGDNLFGFDEFAESIRIFDGTTPYELLLDDVKTALGGTGEFAPSFWRGIKARQISSTQSELYMASQTNEYGLIRVVFGANAGVNDWALY